MTKLNEIEGWVIRLDRSIAEARAWHETTKGQSYTPAEQAAAKRRLNAFIAEHKATCSALHAERAACEREARLTGCLDR